MSQTDPIRKNYYAAVQTAENGLDTLFYFGALLSFAALLVDQNTYPNMYNLVLLLFSLSVLSLFTIGLALRLYLTPRAEDKRRQDFFSNACNVSLIHHKTDGYYNNDLKDPMKRIAAQVLENSLFSKEIALRMARRERVKVVIYILIWLAILNYRHTELSWIIAASQAIFSEQILSKWFRLEWLRIRFERSFEDVFKLFQARPPTAQFNARTLEAVSMYETTKANAAITLSSNIFDDLNHSLSAEWDKVKVTLKI